MLSGRSKVRAHLQLRLQRRLLRPAITDGNIQKEGRNYNVSALYQPFLLLARQIERQGIRRQTTVMMKGHSDQLSRRFAGAGLSVRGNRRT